MSKISQEILDAIPHRDPFLLIDRLILEENNAIECEKTFSGEEYFFAGHYPHYPLVPGVLLCEAAMQAGAVWISRRFGGELANRIPVATRMNDIRFKRMVRPGDTIHIRCELMEHLQNAFFMTAKVTVNVALAVRFEFACAATQAELS